MKTPATIYDNSEKDRKRFSGYFMGALFLSLAAQIAVAFGYLSHVIGGFTYGLPLFFTPALHSKAEITQFGIFRYDSALISNSLKWNEISGVEVDREQQKITVTGQKQGKKRPTSLVIKCPNGELDEVLALLSQKLPAFASANANNYPIPPAQKAPASP